MAYLTEADFSRLQANMQQLEPGALIFLYDIELQPEQVALIEAGEVFTVIVIRENQGKLCPWVCIAHSEDTQLAVSTITKLLSEIGANIAAQRIS